MGGCGKAHGRKAGLALVGDLMESNAEVDKIIDTWVTSDSPGCSLAVAKEGTIIYKRGYGLADLRGKTKNAPETVFHAASLAKQFTAMSILLLLKDAGLDADVRDVIGDLVPGLNEIQEKITIRQMLHHTSGIRDQWVLLAMQGRRLSEEVIKLDDVLQIVKRMRTLNFSPDTAFSYSNTNYTLASLIVERVSRQPLSEFAHKNIFEPLGMKSTRFVDNHKDMNGPNFAYAYRKKADKSFEIRMPNFDLTGPTNLLTTVEDLIKWHQIFDSAREPWVSATAEMQKTVPASGDYALGVIVTTEQGRKIVEHSGRDGGYRSHLIRYPEDKITVALLCNAAPSSYISTFSLVRDVAAVFLPAASRARSSAPKAAAEVSARPEVPRDERPGTYCSEEIATCYELTLDADSLVLQRKGYDPRPLKVAGPQKIRINDFAGDVVKQVNVRFARDKQGKVGFYMDDTGNDRLKDFWFSKQS